MNGDSPLSGGAVARVEIKSDDDFVVVQIRGEVDLSNYKSVEERLLELDLDDDRQVLIDLSQTDYLDSAGVGMLFGLATRLGGEVRLAVLAPQECPAGRVLRLVGIDQVVPLYDSLDDALHP